MVLEIGKVFHFSHCVADLPTADRWYSDVFGGFRFAHYSEPDLGDASFFAIGTEVWEVICPNSESAKPEIPMKRFYDRFGERLHSFSWQVNDIRALCAAFTDAGVRILDMYGSPLLDQESIDPNEPVFTHPKDTPGLLEFVQSDHEQRYARPLHGPSLEYWEQEQGLGMTGDTVSVLLVDDVQRHAKTFSLLGATETRRAQDDGVESITLALGGSVVELRHPKSAKTEEGKALNRNGEGAYTVVFGVRSVDAASAFLQEKTGVDVDDVSSSRLRFKSNAALGVPFEFASVVASDMQ